MITENYWVIKITKKNKIFWYSDGIMGNWLSSNRADRKYFYNKIEAKRLVNELRETRRSAKLIHITYLEK